LIYLDIVKEERPKQARNERSADRFATPRIWSFLWRGAVGGFLGLVVFAVYLFFADIYRLNGLGMTALVAAGNGLLVGAFIFFLGRVLGRDFGMLLRIIAGSVLSFFSMALYSYLAGGFYGDLRWFLSNVILLAVTLGGLAGALASGKSRNEFPKEDHVEQSAGNRPLPWSFLWRGAIGGALGAVALIIYRLLTNPYPLNALFTAALISVANGVCVGAFIWFLGRQLRRRFGMALRIIAGTLFSLCSIAVYLYLEGGLNGDIRPIITNTLAIGLMLGAPAGAIAKENPKVYRLG
jgi:hypothetical protein